MKVCCLVLLLTTTTGVCGYAQYAAIADFVPREHVIFKDDFSEDSENSFPHKWGIHQSDPAYSNKGGYRVKKTIAGAELEIRNVMIGDIFPSLAAPYLPDSFTFGYDFLIAGTYSDADVLFIDSDGKYAICELKLSGTGDFTYWDNIKGHIPHTVNYVAIFKGDSQWHHLDVSWNRRCMKVYVDQYAMIPPVICKSTPRSFQLHCWPPVKYKNILVTGGREQHSANVLQAQKKLVTHAIHFDVNKSVIKPESNDFIKNLAAWLKQNPTIKLEIDGHTDSDGGAAFNMKLSQSRADAVMQALIGYGVTADRLTAVGYGATKPIANNGTEEGKAENRRVEFIRK